MQEAQPPDARRRVPRTDDVLADPRLAAAAKVIGRSTVKQYVVDAQQRARQGDIAADTVADTAVAALPEHATTLRHVINATGVVLHTNIGRAALSAAAVDAIRVAAGHTDVEYDLATGARARRGRGTVHALAAAVPAAEDVHVVNNGAAALVLAATALARGREIVVSRGEMVEIGDGFRLPELLASTGATLHEVGTTNRTSLSDYADAVGPETGFVLKVHPSNFVVHGFTSSVPLAELAELPVPVVVDIGSGLLEPDRLLPAEPDAATALRDGAALVTASGDKLLGGPQAGLLLGRADLVDRLRRHPLARAVRVDKLTLAALEATLRGPEPPAWQALRRDPAAVRARVEAVAQALRADGVPTEVVRTASVVGGGGAPGVELPSWGLGLDAALAAPLRTGHPPVVGRVERDQLVLDLRCVAPEDDDTVRAAVVAAAEA
ncbi:L-seryl-tRNA(Sec) selenium transferase [Haloactinopolyspora sp.]|uniref:L-seryl-tRNA(Sec) selenium transferase n=1 Tax=Haloactinopolyspora sp. TaxID=1966353 RepID=UPI0026098C9A|nr:L-seryl-tRNA(Sec) selenium transferase [Haloactinopolyspora sp.]